jgi:hypothetical protein
MRCKKPLATPLSSFVIFSGAPGSLMSKLKLLGAPLVLGNPGWEQCWNLGNPKGILAAMCNRTCGNFPG